jgi:hypothetical protein
VNVRAHGLSIFRDYRKLTSLASRFPDDPWARDLLFANEISVIMFVRPLRSTFRAMYYEVEIDADLGRIVQLMKVSTGTRCTVGQRLIGVYNGRAYYGKVIGVRLVLD